MWLLVAPNSLTNFKKGIKSCNWQVAVASSELLTSLAHARGTQILCSLPSTICPVRLVLRLALLLDANSLLQFQVLHPDVMIPSGRRATFLVFLLSICLSVCLSICLFVCLRNQQPPGDCLQSWARTFSPPH